MVLFKHALAVATRPRRGALGRAATAKRVLGWFSAFALAAALLSACGGGGNDPGIPPGLAAGVWNSAQWDHARWQ